MLVLPTEKTKSKVENPRFLIIYGKPKSGKTTLVSELEGNLIIDLEGGSEYMNALSIQARSVEDLGEIAKDFINDYRIIGIDSRGHGASTLGKNKLSYELIENDMFIAIDNFLMKKIEISEKHKAGIIKFDDVEINYFIRFELEIKNRFPVIMLLYVDYDKGDVYAVKYKK